MIREGSGYDRFLQWIHVFILMDDTVLLSTTRGGILKKISLLHQYCTENGMIENQRRNFFVINGMNIDRQPLVVNDLVIEHCDM